MAWGILDPVKERLTGAIILVALIVLLVPELLTGPIRAKSASAASATAASPPVAQDAPAETPLRSYTLTLGAAPSAREAAAAPSAAGVTASAQPAESSAQVSPQSSATSPVASAEEGTSKGPDVGPNVSTEPQAAAPSREIGPRTETARLPQQRAASEPDLEAAKPPIHPSVREARSSGSSTGWVVQLGSFASRRNADRLAHSLAGRGFHMSVSPARTGSRVLWRVRVGPAHDRAGAQRLAVRLRALGHRGELLPVR
jgi:DedD protein